MNQEAEAEAKEDKDAEAKAKAKAKAKEELAKEFMANDKKARDKARKQTSIPPQYQAREPEKPGVLKRLQRTGAVVAAAIGGLLGEIGRAACRERV